MIFLINDRYHVQTDSFVKPTIRLLDTEQSHEIGRDLRPIEQIIKQFMADQGILLETCEELLVWRLSFDNGDVLWLAAKTQKAAGRRYLELTTLWRNSIKHCLTHTEYGHSRGKPMKPIRVSRVKNAEDYGHRKIYF